MEKLEVKKGSLLLSMPFLQDPNFIRSVILICEHGDEGSFGLVLNRKLSLKLSDFSMFDNYDDEVYLGGPVQENSIHYIHSIKGLPGAIEIKKNIFWGGEFETLKAMIENKQIDENSIRFYLGYSGWGAGQLHSEFKHDSWIVTNDYSLNIFKFKPEELWRKVLLEMGGKYTEYANYPIDPNLN